MNVILNGTPQPCTDGCTVAQLLESSGFAQRRVAVEVNLRVIPRSRHAMEILRDGDRVEIVHAIGGG